MPAAAPGTQTSTSAPTAPGAGVLSLSDVMKLAQSVGFTGDHIAEAGAIAMAESSGRTAVVNSIGCVGLWQINSRVWSKKYGSIAQLKNPTTNAKAAFGISNGGTNWKPWSTYNGGAYKKFLEEAKKLLPTLAGVAAGPITGPAVAAATSFSLTGGISGAIDSFTETIRKAALSYAVIVLAVIFLILGIVILLRKQAVGVALNVATDGLSGAVGTVAKTAAKGIAK